MPTGVRRHVSVMLVSSRPDFAGILLLRLIGFAIIPYHAFQRTGTDDGAFLASNGHGNRA
jgi:hypothetical protein